MIWSDKTIAKKLDSGELTIRPEPRPEQVQPASLDIRIGEEMYNPESDEYLDNFVIRPGTFYLGHTLESVILPLDAAALVTGRSSVGRRGICVHVTAGFIDPGFEGQITFEVCNFSSREVEFSIGDRIAQLVMFQLTDESTGYRGQYQGQTGVTPGGSI